VAIALSGTVRRSPIEPDRARDVHDAVDAVRVIADALGVAELTLEADSVRGFRAGRAARVLVSGVDAGVVGEIAPDVLTAVGLTGPVVAAELALDALFDAPRRDRTFRTPSRFPASAIDLAFVVDESVPADSITVTLRTAVGDLLEAVRVFDVFRSDALGEQRRSLAFALRLRAADRTLTDAEVGELRRRAIDAVVDAHGAQLRG
jgi:phenylalanyl-tRNA synthetase beta chain